MRGAPPNRSLGEREPSLRGGYESFGRQGSNRNLRCVPPRGPEPRGQGLARVDSFGNRSVGSTSSANSLGKRTSEERDFDMSPGPNGSFGSGNGGSRFGGRGGYGIHGNDPPSPTTPPPEKMRYAQNPRRQYQKSNSVRQMTRSFGEDTQIEISPGVFERLRGAQETWQAVEEGNVAHPSCMLCCLELMCVADAEYVLCPDCKVVSMVEGSRRGKGGVGLGLRASNYNGQRSMASASAYGMR